MVRVQFMGEGGREALGAQVLESPCLQSVVHARTVAVLPDPVAPADLIADWVHAQIA